MVGKMMGTWKVKGGFKAKCGWKVNVGLKVKGGWKVKGCCGCLEMVLRPLLKEKKGTAVFRHARFC